MNQEPRCDLWEIGDGNETWWVLADTATQAVEIVRYHYLSEQVWSESVDYTFLGRLVGEGEKVTLANPDVPPVTRTLAEWREHWKSEPTGCYTGPPGIWISTAWGA